MARDPALDAYEFHRKEWDSYDELRREFEWQVPGQFNITESICGHWSGADDRVAIFGEHEDGTKEVYTFADLDRVTNQLASNLTRHDIEPGDRVGVNTPQRPETALAHLAVWKTGALTVPLSTLFGPNALGYRLSDTDAKLCFVDESNLEELRTVKSDLDDLQTTITVGAEGRTADEIEFWDIEGRVLVKGLRN